MAAAEILRPAVQKNSSANMAATKTGTASVSVNVAGITAGFMNSSLYVGDLEASVDENKLFDLFNQVAPVVSVRVCRDQTSSASLGYAYVNFSTPFDASSAREILNFTPVNGKPIRIMFSHRDPILRKSGYANLFIKNLDSSVDNRALYEAFATFGNVLSCKVAVDNNGKSKGYGFVQFDREEVAQNATRQLNGMLINNKQVYVVTFIRRQERNQAKGSPKFTNVYVKNFSENTTDEDLRNMFASFGPITSAVVMRDANGKTRCFGFVNFENSDAAAAAIGNLNGLTLDGKVLYVGKAEKKAEREARLRDKFEQERNSRFEKLKGCNLYMKNLDDGINEEKLKELFSAFGTVTSCKVMLDQNGASKGAGFVAFSTPEEATKALNKMNGKMIQRKPLYVSVAQRKEERKAWLQVFSSYLEKALEMGMPIKAHFAQRQRPGALLPLQGMHGFHPGAATRLVHQQLYFGQVGPGLIPQSSGYGFQQQHVAELRLGGPSNVVMSFQLQREGQSGNRMGSRRVGNFQQQQQHDLNQGLDRYMACSLNSSMIPQHPMGQVVPFPLDETAFSAAPLEIPHSGPLSKSAPEDQRMMLGEQLYPLVERLEHNHARKVTGMLLEMDQTEVLHLIDSPDALKKKVIEAMDVLSNSGTVL